MLIACAPHQTNMGKREFRQMPTAMRRACGHCSAGPSGVADQSVDISRRPASPAALALPNNGGREGTLLASLTGTIDLGEDAGAVLRHQHARAYRSRCGPARRGREKGG